MRLQIAHKETELVLLYRELMAWDYHVADPFLNLSSPAESYTLPLRTFWKPVYFEEYYEPNLLDPKFAKRVRAYKDKEQ